MVLQLHLRTLEQWNNLRRKPQRMSNCKPKFEENAPCVLWLLSTGLMKRCFCPRSATRSHLGGMVIIHTYQILSILMIYTSQGFKWDPLISSHEHRLQRKIVGANESTENIGFPWIPHGAGAQFSTKSPHGCPPNVQVSKHFKHP